ncbi:MAG: glycosyltransferase [bacterium]|nr:glycosyltransferase [bacterium]
MVSVIIPALNEQETIVEVVSSCIGHPDVSEVIVVDDGSQDATVERATAAGANVIKLPENGGKGAAMHAGVSAAKNDVILFLDADITGITYENISQIIEPVINGQYSMFVGLRSREVVFLNHLLRIFPIIGGERAIVKSLWYAIPAKYRSDFKVEVALNYFSKQTPLGMHFTLIEGIAHVTKEKKYGIITGFTQRVFMVWDILSISFTLYVLGFFKKIFLSHFPRV